MRTFKLIYFVAAANLMLAHYCVHAETMLFDGRPQIGIEFEHEKAASGSSRTNSMTLFPGIVWEDGWITRAELLLMRERTVDSDAGAIVRSYDYSYGVRLRKDVHFTENFGGFLRGLIGRVGNADASYNYAFIEPALRWEKNDLEFYTGYRFIRSIDGSMGHDINQLRLGPGWDITEHHGMDLRWSRSWDARSGMQVSDSVEVEYCYRF
jgi:hypothetical protein